LPVGRRYYDRIFTFVKRRMASYLNAQGIAVVAADMRGHGKSAGKRGVVSAYENFREDLEVLLNETRALYPDIRLSP